MLACFEKYTSKYNIYLNITNKTSNKLKTNILTVSYIYKQIKPSIFFRKLFFRALLLYVNNLYSNYHNICEDNNFYHPNYIYIKYTNTHPSFYYRHIYVH